jgi:hypothetical protein
MRWGRRSRARKDKPALPTWSALNPETTQKLLEQLGRVTTGGATDLGRTLSEAGAMLAPDRLGAVLYVGDGKPTVGELSVKSLRERLSSLPQPLRLYAVGVGDDANLDLLSSLSDASAGQAFRVGDRKSAAETALRVVTHLGRPAVSKLQVAVGSSLDRVYPRETVAVRAGEPLLILARLKKRLPQSITVEGVELGQAFASGPIGWRDTTLTTPRTCGCAGRRLGSGSCWRAAPPSKKSLSWGCART